MKRNILLFLGSGASRSFGKLTTSELLYDLKRNKIDGVNIANAPIVPSMLQCSYKDFEELLQALYDTKDFLARPYGGRFFQEWKDNLILIDRHNSPYNRSQDAYWSIANQQNKLKSLGHMLETINDSIRFLEDVVISAYHWDLTLDPLVNQIYTPLITFLKQNSTSLKIATTNYDRAIEHYCENNSMNFIDGFKQISGNYVWRQAFYYPDAIDEDSIIYYKLHGSLDWKKRRDGKIMRTMEEGRSRDSLYTENLMIYPSLDVKNHKVTPYFEILNEFQKAFNEADICIIIGCSFRDQHVNSILTSGSKRIIAISPTVEEDAQSNLMRESPKTFTEGNVLKLSLKLQEDTVSDIVTKLQTSINR